MVPETRIGLWPDSSATPAAPAPASTSSSPSMDVGSRLPPTRGLKVTSMYPVGVPVSVIATGVALSPA